MHTAVIIIIFNYNRWRRQRDCDSLSQEPFEIITLLRALPALGGANDS